MTGVREMMAEIMKQHPGEYIINGVLFSEQDK
jgi:hypothetical protein